VKITLKISLALLLISSAFFAGCGMKDNNSTNPTVGNFLSITPTDYSQNIGVNDAVTIQFAAPVDTKTIESNFVLISQKDIADSTCPVNKNMGHSDMNKDMMDTTMMNHLKMTHHTKGTFKWNSDRTKCEFKSASSLSPNTDYMMYINSDMINHMKNMMTSNGMMNGGMGMMNCSCGNKGLDKTYFTTRFRTRNN
jgi:hypothetical protein